MEMRVEPEGEIFLDLEGASPAGFHPNNSSYWCTQGIMSDMMIQVLYYDIKYNQGLYQASLEPRNLHIPPSIFNPPDHTYAVSLWTVSQVASGLLSLTIGRAYYAAGFREEVSAGAPGTTALTWAGTDQFGRPTSGANFEAAATGMDPSALTDGLDGCYATFNPEGDMTDAEVWERISPLIYMSRKIQMDGGGFGKFRGGSGIHSLYLVENTDNLVVGCMATQGKVFTAQGSMGAYPGTTNYKHIYRDTNFHELVEKRKPIPFFEGDDPEHPDYTKTMKGELLRLAGQHPVFPRKRGDFVNQFSLSSGGFGDPIDRKPEYVARDLAWKVTSRRAAEKVYGVAVSEDGQVDEDKTGRLREEIRELRKKRGIPARDYVDQYKGKMLKGELLARPKKCLNLSIKNSEKFRKEFIAFWGLGEDFKQIP
jgi:acetone carboxylase alpha subunit